MTSPPIPPKPTPDCYPKSLCANKRQSLCLNGRKCGGFFFLLILTRSRNVCVLNTHSTRGPHSFAAHRKSGARAGLFSDGGGYAANHTPPRQSCAQIAESRACALRSWLEKPGKQPCQLSPGTEGFQQASIYFKGLCGEWGWDRGL